MFASSWLFRPITLPGGVVGVAAVFATICGLLIYFMTRCRRLAREGKIELESRVKEFAQLYESARSADVVKSRLFANLSHELRTPLTLVLGPVERLLSSSDLDPDQRRDLQVVARNARTLLKHVNDLLDVARVEAGHLDLHYYVVDLARVITRAAAHFEAVARERRVSFSIETPETLTAEIDPDKIERVLLNLLSNAFKATPEGGRIRLTASSEATLVKITVSDSGRGVPKEERQHIFERFVQLDATANGSSGTGLGLSIVSDLVAAHGGHVNVSDAEGGGASFTVDLPVRATHAGLVHLSEPSSSGVTRVALDHTLSELKEKPDSVERDPMRDRATVLVVEDNVEMNRFVRTTLAADFHVISAFDGQAGFEAACSEKPDLVVTDVMMPRVSGEELVRMIRGQSELDNLPILVLSAKADEELRVRLLEGGAYDFLLKPFAAPELVARARNLVSMKKARDVLQRDLATQVKDLEVLASEITERKREISAALETTTASKNQAERANRAKATFLRMVSHELRTPLTAVQLQLDRLARAADQMPREQRELVLRSTTSTKRLARLVESILEYTRIEAGRIEISRRFFDPRTVLREVVALTEPQAEAKSLGITLDVQEDLPRVESDPRLVRLVFLNLVENAVKFSDHGNVEIGVHVVGKELCFSVTDHGPGIPEDQHPLVFEPFEQLAPTENKHLPGVGLGLAIVREMVRALGGRVELESHPGEGSRFLVHLPIGSVSAAA